MNRALGQLATWIAGVCVLGATIVFGLAQTTNFIDSVLLCGILTALALFGKSMASEAKAAFTEANILKFATTIVLILALDAMQIFEVYGWKSNMDFLFGESTQAAKTDKLKIELATAKVNMLAVGNIDLNAEASKLEMMETEAAKCKHAWSWSCKEKARAGKEQVMLKLDAQKESVKAISDAQNDIKSTESNTGNYVHRAFKGVALLIDAEVLKVQSGYRLAIATLVVLLYSLGDILFAYPEKRRLKEVYKDLTDGLSEIKRPTPACKSVQTHPEPTYNRIANRHATATMQAQQPEVKDGFVDDLAEQMYDNTPRQEKGFIGFIDTDKLPKVEVKKAQGTATEEIKNKVHRSSIGTKDSTQSGTVQQKGTASKGRGKSAGLEFQVIEDATVSGDFFKFKDTVSIRNLVDYSRYVSPNGSGIGKDTASVYMTMLKEKNRPLSKKQWEDLKGQQ